MSAGSVEALAKFRNKHSLNFPLVSDEGHKTLTAYGVWNKKSLMGKKYMGVERVTYILDAQGRVKHVFPKVKVTGHVKEVLDSLGVLI